MKITKRLNEVRNNLFLTYNIRFSNLHMSLYNYTYQRIVDTKLSRRFYYYVDMSETQSTQIQH